MGKVIFQMAILADILYNLFPPSRFYLRLSWPLQVYIFVIATH